MTIALNAGDTMAVLDFYTRVFERGPDTAPMDDFLEWQICSGTWLQLSTGHERPGANNARVRFEVEELSEAVQRMQAAKVPMGEVVTVAGVVAFSNFSDHWGNALGFYQMLSPRNILSEAERRRQERERQEELEDALLAAQHEDGGEPGEYRPTGAASDAPSSGPSSGPVVPGPQSPAPMRPVERAGDPVVSNPPAPPA